MKQHLWMQGKKGVALQAEFAVSQAIFIFLSSFHTHALSDNHKNEKRRVPEKKQVTSDPIGHTGKQFKERVTDENQMAREPRRRTKGKVTEEN